MAATDHDLPKLIGSKLSILFRISDDPEYQMSEAVGVLQRVESDESGARTLLIRKRDGSLLTIAESDLIKFKRVPPRG